MHFELATKMQFRYLYQVHASSNLLLFLMTFHYHLAQTSTRSPSDISNCLLVGEQTPFLTNSTNLDLWWNPHCSVLLIIKHFLLRGNKFFICKLTGRDGDELSIFNGTNSSRWDKAAGGTNLQCGGTSINLWDLHLAF